MKCANCQTELEAGSEFCARCGQKNAQRPDVIEAELVDESRPQRIYVDQGSDGQSYRQIIYTNFSSPVGGSLGCMPISVTLLLAMLVMSMYGFLAGLGFLFFSAAGFSLTFFVSIKRLFRGQSLNPLLAGVVTWAVSWLLVAWLAGAFV